MIGTIITHYRIVGEIGRGGMGVVYAAEDTRLGRKVAIKMLPREFTADPARLGRFVREAQAASAINHPNIATIYEIDEADGATFIAMEQVEGRTLRDRIGAGDLAPADVLDIARQLAAGLGKAHELGIVHRDVKPENVIVRPDGIPKILDFGIAKLADAAEPSDTTAAMTLTGAGMVLGTARYMSPEQAQARPVDARSDVFSLGAVLYEMATRRPAFPGEGRLDALYAVVNRAPEPIPDDGRFPPGFLSVIARALAKAPGDRFRDCSAMAVALAESASGAAPRQGPATAGAWETATGVVTATAPAAGAPRHAIVILPFQNVTGAADADWMRSGLQVMLASDLAHVPSVRVVPVERLNAVLADLRLAADTPLDESTVRSVADYLSADLVVSGSYVKLGPASRIDFAVSQPETGTESRLKVEARDEAELFATIGHIAAEILRNIETGAERDLVATMVGEAGSRDPASVKAYAEGLAKLGSGNNLEAVVFLKRAVELDPEFAMAHTYLGEGLSNLGRGEEANAALEKAVGLSAGLPRADRLFVSARQALAAGEVARAIESLEQLTRALPNNVGAFYELALAYELEGEWDKAVAGLERVIELDPKFTAALFALGRVNVKRGTCDKALEHLHRALSLNVLAGNEEGEAAVLNAIGLAHFWLDRHDDALKRYSESLAIKRRIGDSRGVSATLSNMAVVYQVRGDFEKAESTYREATDLSREIGDEQGVAENLINLGTLYEEVGRLDDALESYKSALDVEVALGDRAAEALCLNNVGNVYLTQGRVDDAEVYIGRALDARKEIGEAKAVAISVNYIGNIARLKGHYDRAIARYLEAMRTFREIKWRSGEAETLVYMALAMAAGGRHEAALDSLAEADAIYTELGDRSGCATVLTARAEAECALGRCDEAETTGEAAEQAAREVGNDELVAGALLARGKIARKDGRAAEAVELLEKARDAARACGARIMTLRVSIELARAYAAAGRAAEARALAGSATEDVRALRLSGLLAATEEALAEAGAAA